MKINGLGKLFGAAVVADIALNEGRGVKKIAPGCGCYVLFVAILLASPFIWLASKIFF